MSVFTFVRLHAKPGCEQDLVQAASAVLEPTRAEPGCQSIKLFRSTTESGVLYVHSAWRSAEDFQSHAEAPHLKAFLAQAADLMAMPPDVTLTERVG